MGFAKFLKTLNDIDLFNHYQNLISVYRKKTLLLRMMYKKFKFSVNIVNKTAKTNSSFSSDYLTQIVSGSQSSEKSRICNAIARAIYN